MSDLMSTLMGGMLGLSLSIILAAITYLLERKHPPKKHQIRLAWVAAIFVVWFGHIYFGKAAISLASITTFLVSSLILQVVYRAKAGPW